MAIEVQLTDVDPDKMIPRDTPTFGEYHVQIVSVDEYGGKGGEMTVDYEVLSGAPDDQQGKVHRDYYGKKPTQMSRLVQLAIALRMTSLEAIRVAKEKNEFPSLDFENEAPGRQCCIQIEKDIYEGKTKAKVGFGIWDVADPRAQHIPKHDKMLSRFETLHPTAAAAPGAKANGEVKAPAAKAADSEGGDLFD